MRDSSQYSSYHTLISGSSNNSLAIFGNFSPFFLLFQLIILISFPYKFHAIDSLIFDNNRAPLPLILFLIYHNFHFLQSPPPPPTISSPTPHAEPFSRPQPKPARHKHAAHEQSPTPH